MGCSLPCMVGTGKGGQHTHLQPAFPPTFSPELGPRFLPVAAGRPGSILGLGPSRAEGSTTPCIEAVTSRRVAGSPCSGSQQAAEVAAPKCAGGHGGGLRGDTQRHILA